MTCWVTRSSWDSFLLQNIIYFSAMWQNDKIHSTAERAFPAGHLGCMSCGEWLCQERESLGWSSQYCVPWVTHSVKEMTFAGVKWTLLGSLMQLFTSQTRICVLNTQIPKEIHQLLQQKLRAKTQSFDFYLAYVFEYISNTYILHVKLYINLGHDHYKVEKIYIKSLLYAIL